MTNKKYVRLQDILKKYGRVLIAYSGGVDSTFLLAAAVETLGADKVHAVTAVSETYPAAELRQAKRLVKTLDVLHYCIIRTAELANKAFAANAPDRCFHCKNELFMKLSALAKQERLALCDATNYSDRTDYRPGRRAAKKWRVASPLLDARMTKDDIRALSRAMKLPTWDQPAQACLASRIPYGTAISATRLRRIEQGEAFLKKLGFPVVRLRDHGEIVRIETARESVARLAEPGVRERAAAALKKLGWRYVAVDLEGYRTGSLNP